MLIHLSFMTLCALAHVDKLLAQLKKAGIEMWSVMVHARHGKLVYCRLNR